MKKLFAIILLSFLLLSSCGNQNNNPDVEYDTAVHLSHNKSLCMNGIFYFDEHEDSLGYFSPHICFYDFDSMQSAVLCARPNCLHNDPESCTALGISSFNSYPFVVSDSLYFFDETREFVEGKLIVSQDVLKANLDGSSRTKIDVIKGLVLCDLVIKGSTAYFTAAEEIYEDNTGIDTGYAKTYICSYDYQNKKFTNNGLLFEGYHSSSRIIGEYNGGLYISGNCCREAIDFNDYANTDSIISCYLRYDLKTSEITDWDMPMSTLDEDDRIKPMFISSGFYGYIDGNNTHIIDCEGREMVLEDYSLSSSIVDIPINGYYINISGDDYEKSAYTAVNLKTGEILKISKKAVPHWHYVLTYHDGGYIVYSLTGGNDFKKVSEDELFLRSGDK